MRNKLAIQLLIPTLTVLFCVGWLIYMLLHNEVPVDVGDGLMHFFYSQASWEEPSLFLHHWGKPFFILLSSPFAQFGLNGMIVFNILLFIGTCVIGLRILSKFNISIWIQLLFPLILIHANDYSATVLAGLTEPLFNFAILLSLYLFIEKKIICFALIVSLMPFMRSEGQLPVLLALVMLINNKSYRVIPYLFSGFLIYAIVGLFVYHDFWWYFSESPYSMKNDIYGNGTWEHYFISYKNYLGNPGLYILMLGIPVMFFLLFSKKWKELQLEWAFYTYGIFIGVVLSHAYFWATGQNGSYGLTRLATQGMPLFLLLHLYYIGNVGLFRSRIASVLFAGFSVILVIVLSTSKFFPVKALPLDRDLMEAAKFMSQFKEENCAIYFHHPLFAYAYGENPFLESQQTKFHVFGDLDTELKHVIQSGDFIIRDSHFGPVEANLPLEEIQKHPELLKVKTFSFAKEMNVEMNDGVIIYRYTPKTELLENNYR